MPYGLLADTVLALHALFVLFVALGGLAAWLRPRLAWLHLPAAAWGVWITTSGGICPLTPLENHLRRAAGQQGYAGGFIEHYAAALVYPDGLTREVQVGLGVLAAAFNLAVYAALWLRCRRRARRGAQ